jgi:deoxycytidine triphosphate deaminase
MSVIALTVSGDEPSVVTSNDKYDRDGSAILIQNSDDKQLSANATECNASYDLRVGQIYRDHRNLEGQQLGLGGTIDILPGNAVIIETEELVKFPKYSFGQILPKVSLLQQGIANTPSKVDPGYEGHLLITAFNHGKRAVALKRYQPFCSLHIFDIHGSLRPYDKEGKRIQGIHRAANFWRRTADWIDANVARVTFIQTTAK